MLQPHPSSPMTRRGVILMVVLSLLTLFAIVGLSFVLYAETEAKGSRIFREGGVLARSDTEPELLFSYFLGQLIYDAHDTESNGGVHSALRGHSLMRSMYGWNNDTNAVNNMPYNGLGRIHEPITFIINGTPKQQDGYDLINYTCFVRSDGSLVDNWLRDPERLGTRSRLVVTDRGLHTGGFNAPYTYPDANNMYLAAVRADGTVLVPSFHRDYTSIDPTNGTPRGFGPLWRNGAPSPNWYSNPAEPWMKYMTLRPRPAEHPTFPPPEDEGGDVKNLVGTPGPNDSIWIDLGFPVKVTPDGKKYKPLFAPLIIDLDNKINLGVHGNVHGRGWEHRSNQGWGRWEVNPARLVSPLNDPTGSKQAEWANILRGSTSPPQPGLYGPNGIPTYAGHQAPVGRPVHFYAGVDYDARQVNGRPSDRFLFPGQTGHSSATLGFPEFQPRSYGNYRAHNDELTNHPLLYNPLFPQYFTPPPGRTNDDRTFFRSSNMEALQRYGDTNSPALTSAWYRLLPQNMNDLTADPKGRLRRMLTMYSFDVDRPGLMPWVWNRNLAPYRLAPGDVAPTGGAIPFPFPVSSERRNPTPSVPVDSEYKVAAGANVAADWRGQPPAVRPFPEPFPAGLAATRVRDNTRVDLNRFLPEYPRHDTLRTPPPRSLVGRINVADLGQFNAAQRARVQLAQDIFNRLWTLTGAANPVTLTQMQVPAAGSQGSQEFEALRWLAQLAVNIVDYIDPDDYITPFMWFRWQGQTPGDLREFWVYGTELPRVALSEAFAQWQPGPASGAPLTVKVWAELVNTLRNDATLTDNGAAKLHMPRASSVGANNGPAYGIYRLALCKQSNPGNITIGTHLRLQNNVSGSFRPLPNNNFDYVHQTPQSQDAIVDDFSTPSFNTYMAVPYLPVPTGPIPPVDPRFILPFNTAAPPPYSTNRVYYLLGPDALPGTTPPNLTLRSDRMQYQETPAADPPPPPAPPTLVLQRLACPHLPPNDYVSPGQLRDGNLPYNPYITVDYMEDVPVYLEGQPGFATGRKQPYAGLRAMRAQQSAAVPPGQPQHTFFQPNSGHMFPYDWLVHLDRQLISPMELLHVSAFKPHELTQQFLLTEFDKFKHRANWFDDGIAAGQSTRLYRALEYMETHDRAAGMLTFSEVTGIRHIYPGSGRRHIVPRAMEGVTQPIQGLGSIGMAWRIQEGTVLILDRGTANEETVIVESRPDATSFICHCHRPHGNNGTITVAIMGDRVPGRININTLWDGEILAALCDPQTANNFNLSHVFDYATPYNYAQDTIFGSLVSGRTPGFANAAPAIPIGVPGPADRPFLPLTAGLTLPNGDPFDQYPNGIGLENTLLRSFRPPGGRRLFQPPLPAQQPPLPSDPDYPILYPNYVAETHPYTQSQLLTKIYNNLTTRSNVFAIWVTVGFFEVTDDTTRPVTLGKEIGRDENRHVRHRMFSIVDRSHQATSVPTTATAVSNRRVSAAVTAGQGVAIVPVNSTPPNAVNMTNIHPGQVLTISWTVPHPITGAPIPVNINVTVLSVNLTTNPPEFTVNLPRDVPAGASITGSRPTATAAQNPGPNAGIRFDPRGNPGLVPYYSVID